MMACASVPVSMMASVLFLIKAGSAGGRHKGALAGYRLCVGVSVALATASLRNLGGINLMMAFANLYMI